MKLGINTCNWSHAHVALKESLKRAARLGFKYVDIFGAGHGDPRILSQTDRLEIKAVLDKEGLIPSNFCAIPTGNVATDDPSKFAGHIEWMHACVDLAAFLGFRQILTLTGSCEYGVSREKSWRNYVAHVREMLPHVKQENMVMTVETFPMVYRLLYDTREQARFLDEVGDDHLLANVDIGHLAVCRETPDVLKSLEGRVAHAHITDTDGVIDSNEAIGTGIVPLEAYIEALDGIGLDRAAQRWGGPGVAAIELGTLGRVNLLSADSLAEVSKNNVLGRTTRLTLS